MIRWYNGKQQTLTNVKADQVVTVRIADAKTPYSLDKPAVAPAAIFKEVTKEQGIGYRHHDYDLIDFNYQHLLPHKLSEYCPALAAGDLDGNGLDDLVIGGNGVWPTRILLQQPDGRFLQKDSIPGSGSPSKFAKDEGILIFDANGDGKPDLYIAGGGYGIPRGQSQLMKTVFISTTAKEASSGFRGAAGQLYQQILRQGHGL